MIYFQQAISKDNAGAINDISNDLNSKCPALPKVTGQLLYGKVCLIMWVISCVVLCVYRLNLC